VTARRRWSTAVTAVAFTLGVSSCGLVGGGPETMTVTALFDEAVGIYESGDVLVLDRRVGSIDDVALDGDLVRVTLQVRRDVPLPANVTAAIQAQTVLGERAVTLSPPWNREMQAAGRPRLREGATIPPERTIEPVEPDEALQAFNELIASIDPDAAAGLVSDSADILQGRGERIGESIDAVADLSETLTAVDHTLLETVRSINQVASTLNARDDQLRSLIDDFGAAVTVLADERSQIETLVSSLVGVTGEVEAIVDRHGGELPQTIAKFVAFLQVLQANADTIPALARDLPQIAESFERAYKPEIDGFFLKADTLPIVETVLVQLLDAVGLYQGEV
jgi:phospholipid/cholesterol/gamma-HCH transport system substrate-binding protein